MNLKNNTKYINDYIDKKYIYGYSNAKKLIDMIRLYDKLPLSRVEIKFSSDIWDLRERAINRGSNHRYSFKFSDCPSEYKDIIKLYVLLKILEDNNKITSINRKFKTIKRFLNYLVDRYIFKIEYMTYEDLKEFIELREKEIAITTCHNEKGHIKDFIELYSANFNNILTKDIKTLLSSINIGLLTSHQEVNKYPLIPHNYFIKMRKIFEEIMNNENVNVEERGFACILIILSQTGLRASELGLIEVNSIRKEKLKTGIEAHYMYYRTLKEGEGDDGSIISFTYINELAYHAFNILLNIYSNHRIKMNTNYLYTPAKVKSYPVSADYLSEKLKYYIFKHREEFNCLKYDDFIGLRSIRILDYIKRKDISLKRHPIDDDQIIMYYPAIHQFRVTVCTELYNKGVPLEYIQKYMSHLSDSMKGYYVRPKKNLQEDVNYTRSVLKDIISGNVRLLGEEKQINSLTGKIEEFLVKGHFNVKNDIDEIIDVLIKKIPIRAKLGGVCINSAMLRDCKFDDKSNEFFCAYGICPNHFHFFYMADISFNKFREVNNTYLYNIKNGFFRQAQKEGYKIIKIISESLLPELDELDNEIKIKGKVSIIKQYPNLKELIENYTFIYNEILDVKERVIEWMKLKK